MTTVQETRRMLRTLVVLLVVMSLSAGAAIVVIPTQPVASQGLIAVALDDDPYLGDDVDDYSWYKPPADIDRLGYGGNGFWFTVANGNDTDVDNWAQWKFNSVPDGRYEVQAWIPSKWATAHAQYLLWVNNEYISGPFLNQETVSGWQTIGSYNLNGNILIEVRDARSLDDHRDVGIASARLAADAIRLVPVGGPTTPPPVLERSVRLDHGVSAQGEPGCSSVHCKWFDIDLVGDGWDRNERYSVDCYHNGIGNVHPAGRFGAEYGYAGNPNSFDRLCYFGFPGVEVYVEVDGVRSNLITWTEGTEEDERPPTTTTTVPEREPKGSPPGPPIVRLDISERSKCDPPDYEDFVFHQSWSKPEEDGGSAVTGYQWRHLIDGRVLQGSWSDDDDNPMTTDLPDLTGLVDTKYVLQVRAKNEHGFGPIGTSNPIYVPAKYETRKRGGIGQQFSHHRVYAVRDFVAGEGTPWETTVRKGDYGGKVVYNAKTLSQLDSAWIFFDAAVSEFAHVCEDAIVGGKAAVSGNAEVRGTAVLGGGIKVNSGKFDGNAEYIDAADAIYQSAHRTISDNVLVCFGKNRTEADTFAERYLNPNASADTYWRQMINQLEACRNAPIARTIRFLNGLAKILIPKPAALVLEWATAKGIAQLEGIAQVVAKNAIWVWRIYSSIKTVKSVYDLVEEEYGSGTRTRIAFGDVYDLSKVERYGKQHLLKVKEALNRRASEPDRFTYLLRDSGWLDRMDFEVPYLDVSDTSVHYPGIRALTGAGVFEGTECAPGQFCPGGPVPRWVMAVWLVRILDGADPAAAKSRFADVVGSPWWEGHVERLAELGVTVGCGSDPLRFCPEQTLSRAQMATILARAFELSGPDAGFADMVAGSVHYAGVNALAASGITTGCSTTPYHYCPNQPTTRAQMTTFLHRAHSLGDGWFQGGVGEIPDFWG